MPETTPNHSSAQTSRGLTMTTSGISEVSCNLPSASSPTRGRRATHANSLPEPIDSPTVRSQVPTDAPPLQSPVSHARTESATQVGDSTPQQIAQIAQTTDDQTTPTSRRTNESSKKRRRRKLPVESDLLDPVEALAGGLADISLSDQTRTRTRTRRLDDALSVGASHPSIPRPIGRAAMAAPAQALRPLLVCALGNPGAQYAHTFHSAGLTAIQSLASSLGLPPFTSARSLSGGGGHQVTESFDPDLTLWLSGSYMNTSGPAVAKTWKSWPQKNTGLLVVVHDELERALGKISVRWEGSARGHNGLKSLQKSIPSTRYARIGIGIGRPASREPDDVAKYVLRKMNPSEMIRIQEAGVRLEGILRAISEGDERQKSAS